MNEKPVQYVQEAVTGGSLDSPILAKFFLRPDDFLCNNVEALSLAQLALGDTRSLQVLEVATRVE